MMMIIIIDNDEMSFVGILLIEPGSDTCLFRYGNVIDIISIYLDLDLLGMLSCVLATTYY